MNNNYPQIQELLHQRADYQARLNLLPYDGSPEVKERDSKRYLYIRKRVGSRLTSTYVGEYSDNLYQLLLRNARESRELKSKSADWIKSWHSSGIPMQSCLQEFSSIWILPEPI